MKVFYLVWNAESGSTSVRHGARVVARKEASRLAMANPGQAFHVLTSLGSVTRRDSPLVWDEPPFDDLPPF